MNDKPASPLNGVSAGEGEASGKSHGESRPRTDADAPGRPTGSREDGDTATTPLAQSLRGALRGASVDEAVYRDHLADRHR